MAKTDHKAKKAKQRKEANRKRKAVVASQPRVLRQNPDLGDALSTRHPLLGYYVNQDWQDAKMASVHVIRDAPTGQVHGGFLVDLAEKGLKDTFGNFGVADAMSDLQSSLNSEKVKRTLVPLAPATAINLIRGGIEWARRWRYRLPDELDLWIKLVDPATDELDLTIFGARGERPIVIRDITEQLGRIGLLDDEDLDELEDDDEWELEGDEDEDETEPAPPPPTRLWTPSAGAAQPSDDENQPRSSSGLWLPS